MKKRRYILYKNKFRILYDLAQEIHGNTCIIQKFCKDYENIDDFYKIVPLIKNTTFLTDKLYCEFINLS